MYVLTFIMAMMLLLSAMTYARLNLLVDSAAVQASFLSYTEVLAHNALNQEAEKKYSNSHVKQEENEESPPKKTKKGTGRINIALLLDPQSKLSQPLKYQQTATLFKKLLYSLYGKQPFFLEAEQKRPYFLDELLDKIANVIEKNNKNQKITQAKQLANINLEDPQLNEIFYRILHGKPVTDEPKESIYNDKNKEEDFGSKFDEDEYRSPEGYLSILDFVTVSDNQGTIRVFLASPYVLEALIDDKQLVSQILEERKIIYKLYIADKINKSAAEKQLEEILRGLPPEEKKLLDYTITKTNPEQYEN